jgi:deoxyribose-phosphate aldolase
VLATLGTDGQSPWTPTVAGTVLRVPLVEAVGLEERAATLATRSVKKEAKRAVLELLVRCCDLTTLEGSDTPGRVRSLCAKARVPLPGSDLPSVGAVCVYPNLVPVAVEALRGTGIGIASVAGAFPSGLSPLSARLDEVRFAVEAGATEIDMVLDRSAFLAGRYREAFDSIAATKEACGDAHLKVILETGELGSYDLVRRASALAMAAGADFIKTSTGKIPVAATLPVGLCMAEAIRDFAEQTGRRVGLKIAGGVKTAKQGWQHMVVLQETLGPEWLDPSLYRIGASGMLDDVLFQYQYLTTGRYPRREYVGIV